MLAGSDGGEKTGLINLFDEISRDEKGFPAKALVASLNDLKEQGCKSLVLRINSPGGDVFEALAMYDLLRTCGLSVRAEVFGVAASAATLVAIAADDVRIAPAATWMVHEPYCNFGGTLEDVKAGVQQFERTRARIYDIYSQVTGKPVEILQQEHAHEKWYTPEEAVAYGWAHGVLQWDGSEETADGSPGESEEELLMDGEIEEPEEEGEVQAEEEKEETPVADEDEEEVPLAEEYEELTSDSGTSLDDEESSDNGKPRAAVARVTRRCLSLLGISRPRAQKPGMSRAAMASRLRQAEARAAGAECQLQRNLADMKKQSARISALVNREVARALAGRGVTLEKLPAPRASLVKPDKKDLAAAYKEGGIDAVLEKLTPQR